MLSGGDLATTSLFCVLTVLLAWFWLFERSAVSLGEMSAIAALGAVAAALRVPFAGLPSVQPVTFLVTASGYVLGSRAGFLIACVAVVVSNFFLGHGPWTPWQMVAWGLAGALAGKLRGAGYRAPMLLCTVWGYLFGWIMNFWFWAAFLQPRTLYSFAAACLASFWLDTMHALGNALLWALFGRRLLGILERFRPRM
ncbi:MAG: ECF transporter S component [Bacillota bacterium]